MTGLLWMDDSDIDVTKKVREAARRFAIRLGEPATLCYANPMDVPEPIQVGAVRIEPRSNIHRNHFLVGRAPNAGTLEEVA